jgi:16S rRNA G966 N2-methylase RsmD
VRRGDAFAMLAAPPNRTFDYVYIAPPQYQELWSKALLALDANPGWLSEDAWVIVQIHPREYKKLDLKNLSEFEERKYGSTLLVFYERNEKPCN